LATTCTGAVPVIEAANVSVAVRDWVPLTSVTIVAENVPTPLASVASGGSVARPSELVKWTTPA